MDEDEDEDEALKIASYDLFVDITALDNKIIYLCDYVANLEVLRNMSNKICGEVEMYGTGKDYSDFKDKFDDIFYEHVHMAHREIGMRIAALYRNNFLDEISKE